MERIQGSRTDIKEKQVVTAAAYVFLKNFRRINRHKQKMVKNPQMGHVKKIGLNIILSLHQPNPRYASSNIIAIGWYLIIIFNVINLYTPQLSLIGKLVNKNF